MRYLNKLSIKCITFYQNKISANTTPKCRYYPTCSNYAKEAFEKRNFFVAFFLSFFRILRCNPLFKGGYDPVPKSRKEKKKEED